MTDLVVPAVGPDRWEPLLELAAREPGVHAGLGIHPQLLPDLSPADDERHLARLDALASRCVAAGGCGVVAIGECGLDGPTASASASASAAAGAGAPLDRQLAVLRAHLDIARRHGLPVLLHCLRAHEALVALFEREPPPPGTVLLHSFSGSAEQARLYARWDPYFSFAGPITYESARKPVAAARAVARDRVVIETDAPDQTPRPHRGRCEPAHLAEVADGLARALGCDRAEADQLTSRNARALFRLPSAR